jgi:hypothetical protein
MAFTTRGQLHHFVETECEGNIVESIPKRMHVGPNRGAAVALKREVG